MLTSIVAKARLVAALAVLAASLLPTIASAHPLGNFTVNHYARIEPAGDRVQIVYVLDMAEIPTFQEKPRIDPNPDLYASQRADEIRQNLQLTLNGVVTPLVLEQHALSFPDGAGGLQTLRLEATYAADLRNVDPSSAVDLVFRDDNDPTRIGWREIVARPGAVGTSFQQASVPQQDTTNELRQYPEDLLNSPLSVREARVSFVPGAAAARPMLSLGSTGVGVLDKTRSAFAELANGSELTPGFILFAIGVAIVLGAAHALQPGHGKTVVAAYLVGSRGTARHALFLGGTVTATHTAGVYALGLVTLFLSQYILPERLYPILEIASGLLVVAIGAWLFGQRLLAALGFQRGDSHDHGHDHDHAHSDHHAVGSSLAMSEAEQLHHPVGSSLAKPEADYTHSVRTADAHSHGDLHHPVGSSLAMSEAEHLHHPVGSSLAKSEADHTHSVETGVSKSHSHGGKAHSHAMPERVGWKSLLALGVSGGLLPCPEALMVLLITIAAHRVLFGLLLIVSFSTGLAAVLVGFGLLLVYARGFFGRINLSGGWLPKILPVASALVIVVAGGVITVQALPQVL